MQIKKLKKIGILGGTFDPAHIGHVKISSIAKRKYKLEYIIWAVTKKNPFKKKTHYNLKKRILLANLISKNKAFIKVRYYEDKIRSNKTYKLIEYLKNKNLKFKLFLIMGADNLINFHKWDRWKEISSNCNILVFDREGYKAKSLKSKSFKKLNKKGLQFIKFKKVNISSSKLRKI